MANKRTYINADEELIIQGKLTIEGEFEQKQYVETQTFTESKYLGDKLIINADGFAPGAGGAETVGIVQLRSGDSNVFLTHNVSAGTFTVSNSNTSVANVLTVDGNLSAGNVIATGFTGALTGNATSADALSSAVTVQLQGDATGSATFTNAGDSAVITVDISNSGVTGGAYGSATQIPTYTVAADGRLSAANDVSIQIPKSQVTNFDAEVRALVGVTDAGGDGSLTYDSGTGVITYTGPSAAEVRAHFSGGTGVDITNGVVSIDQSVATTADVTFNNVTASANFIGDVTGNVSGTSATLSGTVSFGSLTDGNFTITDITDTVSDNDALLPTAGAIVDYIANNAAEGLLLRQAFSANSSDSTFDIGTMPNNTARTYYANKLVLKVSTAFSGGSVNAIKITENGAAGSTVVAVDDADVTTIGTYVVELDGDIALTKNAPIRVSFVQSDGNTAAVPSTGAMTASIHYNFV